MTSYFPAELGQRLREAAAIRFARVEVVEGAQLLLRREHPYVRVEPADCRAGGAGDGRGCDDGDGRARVLENLVEEGTLPSVGCAPIGENQHANLPQLWNRAEDVEQPIPLVVGRRLVR